MASAPALAQSAGASGEVTPKSNGLSNTSVPVSSPTETSAVDPFARDRKFDREMHFPDNVRLAREKGEYDAAAALMEEFILKDKKAKDNPCAAAVMRCFFYLLVKNVDPKYAESFKAALQTAENLPECSSKSALYYWKAKNIGYLEPDSVMNWLDKAIEAEPYPDIYTMRGDKLYMIGETKKACADYKKAMAEDPFAKSAYERYFCEDLEKNAAAEPKK